MQILNDYPFGLDYLCFTYKPDDIDHCHDIMGAFFSAFPELEFVMDAGIYLSHGRYGYTKGVSINDLCSLLWNEERLDMGVHVEVPSHCLDDFACALGVDPVNGNECVLAQQLLSVLFLRGVKFSRLDVCFDDASIRFTASDFARWFQDGRIRTKARTHSYISTSRGCTFTLGKRSGGKFLRIYDKWLESHGLVWSVRYEMEFKGEVCQDLVSRFLSDSAVNTFVATLLDFCMVVEDYKRTDNESSNAVRKCNAKPYQQFTSLFESQVSRIVSDSSIQGVSPYAEPLVIHRLPEKTKLENKIGWLRAGGALKLISQIEDACGSDFLHDLIDEVKDAVDEEYLASVQRYQREYVKKVGNGWFYTMDWEDLKECPFTREEM